MSSEAELGAAATVWLVAKREVTTRLRTRAWRFTTLALLAAVVLGGVLANFAATRQVADPQVALVPSTSALREPLRVVGEAAGMTVRITELPDDAAAEAAVRAGDVNAALTGAADDFTVAVDRDLSLSLAPVLTAVRQQVALAQVVSELGGDPAQVSQELAGAQLRVTALNPNPATDPARIVAGYLAGILLFIGMQYASQLVAQGVVEEKSSRVVEILLATIRPWQLMAGKVLGIGIVGVAQLAVVLLGAVGTAAALGMVPAGSLNLTSAAAWALVWFLLGYTLVALAIAALAALVSRQEEVGSVTAPVMMLLIIPYIIGVSVGPWQPDSTLIVWLSIIPISSSMVMPIRIAMGVATGWQIALAVGLSLALLPVLVWAAGRVYSAAVLRTGAKVPFREALRALARGSAG
ncbi:MAG: ABC transporter permease [Candidatus Nanopelagicales bacterium]